MKGLFGLAMIGWQANRLQSWINLVLQYIWIVKVKKDSLTSSTLCFATANLNSWANKTRKEKLHCTSTWFLASCSSSTCRGQQWTRGQGAKQPSLSSRSTMIKNSIGSPTSLPLSYHIPSVSPNFLLPQIPIKLQLHPAQPSNQRIPWLGVKDGLIQSLGIQHDPQGLVCLSGFRQ